MAKSDKEEKVDPEAQAHIDARDLRVAAVKNAIAEAKAVRDENEKKGIAETQGAKLDREAKEKEDLAAAQRVNVIEPFSLSEGVAYGNNLDMDKLARKLSEVITHLNKVD